jgi:hypothetical protein
MRDRHCAGDVMGYSQYAEGWLFRVVDPNPPSPRYFVAGSPAVEDARQLLRAHPDVDDGEKVEAVGPVSVSNMLEFEVGAGEAKEIDTPYQ